MAKKKELTFDKINTLISENVFCWCCGQEVKVYDIMCSDGYCPKCDSPIDLDEYED